MVKNRRKPRTISITDELWAQVEQEAATTGQSLSSVIVHALSRHFQSQMVRSSSWETDDEDTWYDETKFYTFSQDKFGHSAKIEITIPKMTAGEVAGLVDSGKVPELRTTQDFYRNAIRHWIYQTGRMLREGRLIDAAHHMTVLDRIATQQSATSDYEELETRMMSLLDEELILGHYDFVAAELDVYWDAVSSVNERFRDRYEALLRTYQARLKEAREMDSYKGTHRMPDGRIFKNGIELASKDERRRRRSSTS